MQGGRGSGEGEPGEAWQIRGWGAGGRQAGAPGADAWDPAAARPGLRSGGRYPNSSQCPEFRGWEFIPELADLSVIFLKGPNYPVGWKPRNLLGDCGNHRRRPHRNLPPRCNFKFQISQDKRNSDVRNGERGWLVLACLSAERNSISLQFTFYQILALKVDHGDI